jgi:hypothetical protein
MVLIVMCDRKEVGRQEFTKRTSTTFSVVQEKSTRILPLLVVGAVLGPKSL